LLEVNVSPSLSSSSPFDKRIKTCVLTDIFNIIGLRLVDKKYLTKKYEFDNIKTKNENKNHKNILKRNVFELLNAPFVILDNKTRDNLYNNT
jgi:tubulin polyglutamylase TTLL4